MGPRGALLRLLPRQEGLGLRMEMHVPVALCGRAAGEEPMSWPDIPFTAPVQVLRSFFLPWAQIEEGVSGHARLHREDLRQRMPSGAGDITVQTDMPADLRVPGDTRLDVGGFGITLSLHWKMSGELSIGPRTGSGVSLLFPERDMENHLCQFACALRQARPWTRAWLGLRTRLAGMRHATGRPISCSGTSSFPGTRSMS